LGVGEHAEMARRGGPCAVESVGELAGGHGAAADAQDREDLAPDGMGECVEHCVEPVELGQTLRAIVHRVADRAEVGELHRRQTVAWLTERSHGLPDLGDVGMIVGATGRFGVDPLEDRHHDGVVTLTIHADELLLGCVGDELESPHGGPVRVEKTQEGVEAVGLHPEGADRCWHVTRPTTRSR